ncbi:hypothetical protein DR950_36140 [Kitasatospora xanthocidica]|uniref:Uncharacterized protein n=1 Tax=Kitasatospora xanthocidica TaxID=83382 RepID=A0A373A4G9_9ACTN|nr:hypothetical protein [Kitasatospora xanthocidica]RGD62467.1 hypothetical protein DR950_36140 [Kitasatospora xanthocidica]
MSDETPAPQDGADPTTPDLQAEVDKWKSLARKHEARAKDSWSELEALKPEFDALKQASLSDQELAVETARQEGRRSAAAEFGTRVATAELKAAAAAAGARLPDADFLNLSRFVGEDGTPNSEAISSFVDGLPKARKKPEYRQDLGLGPQGGGAGAGQVTRDQLKRMTRQEISKARSEGRLDAIMRGQL